MFLPGFMQRADAWAPVAERVGERYPSTALDFSTWTFGERVGEALAAGPRGSALVGYSMGGRIALHAALRRPGRLAAVGLVGASAGIEDPAERRRRRERDEQLAGWMDRASIDEVVERWERLAVFESQSPAVVAAQRAGRRSHAPKLLARLLRSAGQGTVPPVWSRLPELGLPLLAVAGALDHPYAEAARRMAALAPRGRAAIVDGAGHAPQLERPDAVAALVLAFLDETRG